MVNDNDLTIINKVLGCRDIVKVGVKFARSFTMSGLRKKPRNDLQKKQIATRKHNLDLGLRVSIVFYLHCF